MPATACWSRWLTQVVAGPSRACSRSAVTASAATSATRRSGPRNLAVERTSAQRGHSGGVTRSYDAVESAQKWSSSMTSTCGCRDRTARSSAARAAVTLAPVGLCARGVQITARAPASSARSSPSGVIPDASTATGSAANPFSRSVLMCARKHGSSTATASPRVRCAASSRSIASTAPWVTTTSNGPARSNRSRASAASAGNSAGAP